MSRIWKTSANIFLAASNSNCFLLTRLGWMLRLEAGREASQAMLGGYGNTIDQVQLARWAVYHSGMMLVSSAEETVRSGGPDFGALTAQLDDAIEVANAE